MCGKSVFRPTSVVVEFLGLPGTGKSRLSHETAKCLIGSGIAVTEGTRETTLLDNGWLRKLAKMRHILVLLVFNLNGVMNCMRLMLRSKQLSWKDFLTSSANILYVLNLQRRFSNEPGIHLLDQGLAQACWSVSYSSRYADQAIDTLWRFVRPWAGQWVVSIQADTITVCRRLQERSKAASRLEAVLGTDLEQEAFTKGLSILKGIEQSIQRDRNDERRLLSVTNNDDEPVEEKAKSLAKILVESLQPTGC